MGLPTIPNIFDNIKKFFIDNIQKTGGKITQDMLKNLQIKGSGAIEIVIGEIKINGVNLDIQVIDLDNKNAQIVNVNIPLGVSIQPAPIEIPIKLEGEFK